MLAKCRLFVGLLLRRCQQFLGVFFRRFRILTTQPGVVAFPVDRMPHRLDKLDPAMSVVVVK